MPSTVLDSEQHRAWNQSSDPISGHRTSGLHRAASSLGGLLARLHWRDVGAARTGMVFGRPGANYVFSSCAEQQMGM
jgi:hypothetical protein